MIESPSAAPHHGFDWPEMPYKGFSFYGPKDVPLFAGRDAQISEFARMIAFPDTRFVLLYGATGCGKSSFLRAGLIPFLESRQRGFEFRKQQEGQAGKAIFIRSTETPLQELAKEIFKLAAEGYSFRSPFGEEKIDLTEGLFCQTTADDFTRFVLEEPKKLVEALRTIAAALPVTLVLVIDQGEEVLSLRRGLDFSDAQSSYFKFLSLFGLSDFPLKLIIALRNEFYGDFQAAINEYAAERVPIVYYRLKNLRAKELVDAIKRPTQTEAVGDYGPPRYGFKFEEYLPEIIVDDLIRTARAGGLVGGELPVLQVVCETLYNNTRNRPSPWTITAQDYIELGEIETQLNDYLDRVLIDFCDTREMPAKDRAAEILHWKDALTELAEIQPNNTVTTARKVLDDLIKAVGTSARYFAVLLKYLAGDDRAVLREERVRKIGFDAETFCYSLRHDAVGLVLVRWQAAREASRGVAASISLVTLLGATSYGLLGIFTAGVGVYQFFFVGRTLDSTLLLAGTVVAFFTGWSLTRTPKGVPEFSGFRLQLLAVRSPVFRFFTFGRVLDAEGIRKLEQNPVFRLYMRTTPYVQQLFAEARQRFQQRGSSMFTRSGQGLYRRRQIR